MPICVEERHCGSLVRGTPSKRVVTCLSSENCTFDSGSTIVFRDVQDRKSEVRSTEGFDTNLRSTASLITLAILNCKFHHAVFTDQVARVICTN